MLPMRQMDTNAAYQMARAKMDVPSLNRDCDVRIVAQTPQGEKGKHFCARTLGLLEEAWGSWEMT